MQMFVLLGVLDWFILFQVLIIVLILSLLSVVLSILQSLFVCFAWRLFCWSPRSYDLSELVTFYLHHYHPGSKIHKFLGCWIHPFIDLMLSLFLTLPLSFCCSILYKLRFNQRSRANIEKRINSWDQTTYNSGSWQRSLWKTGAIVSGGGHEVFVGLQGW